MQVTTSRVGGFLPRQIQRVLPVCLAFVFLILFFSKAESLGAPIKPADMLKRIISYQMPIQLSRDEIPKKIWQTWKVAPLEFDDRDSSRARSWTAMNKGWRYEVLTDDGGLHYVETNYGPNGLNRPDIVYIYKSLTATIIKADLLRYLVMYIEGGVYADIDVEALQPADMFIPDTFSEKDVDLVIGVEIDEPTWANHTILGPKSQSFCQWTFMCKPRVPVIMRLIDNIVEWLNYVARMQHVPISEISLNFDEVISGTGPSAFTTAILRDMSAQTGKYVHWDQFHALEEPKQVGNILVLTVHAFAAGQGHSNSDNHNNPKARVKHHYHASLWPDKHPRYSHPAYGMVEECNWHKECVDAWDANTLAYKSLPEDQQQQLIAIKVAADKEKFDKKMAEDEANQRMAEAQRQSDLEAQCNPPPPEPEPSQPDPQIVLPHANEEQGEGSPQQESGEQQTDSPPHSEAPKTEQASPDPPAEEKSAENPAKEESSSKDSPPTHESKPKPPTSESEKKEAPKSETANKADNPKPKPEDAESPSLRPDIVKSGEPEVDGQKSHGGGQIAPISSSTQAATKGGMP